MPNGQWAGSTRRYRLPSNWYTELVPETFEVYGDTCHWCGKPGANQVDHVNPGDDHSLENRRPIHADCHQTKSSIEGGRAAQARKPRRQRPPEPHPGLLTP